MRCDPPPALCRLSAFVLILCWHRVLGCLDEKDAPSKAPLSPVVFVGKFLEVIPDRDHFQRATFRVAKKHLLKASDDIPPIFIGKKKKNTRIHVLFSNATGGALTPAPLARNADGGASPVVCALTVRELIKNSPYFIYAYSSKMTASAKSTLYGIAPPDRANKKMIKTVRKVVNRSLKAVDVKGLSDTTIEVKSHLILRCSVSGNPPPTIEWLKDNKKLKAKDKVTVKTKTNSSLLEIRRIRLADSGNYTCRASNAHSSKAATARVSVMTRKGNRRTTQGPLTPKPKPKGPNAPLPTSTGTTCSPDDNFCLNGGKCEIFTEIEERYCQCAEGFRGNRCEFKDVNTQGIRLWAMASYDATPLSPIEGIKPRKGEAAPRVALEDLVATTKMLTKYWGK